LPSRIIKVLNRITRTKKSTVTNVKNPISGFVSRVEKIKRELMVRKLCIKEA